MGSIRCDARWFRARAAPPLSGAAPAKRSRSPAADGPSPDAEVGPSARRSGAPDGRPMQQRWRMPRRQWVGDGGPGGDLFMLMSYNILGDYNAFNHRDLYWNVPLAVLKWRSRRRLISEEICQCSPDIVCLQEVDKFEDIMLDLKRKGYAGSLLGRSGDAVDGCATFWKKKRVQLVEEDSIEYCAYDLRNNVAQLFVFELDGRRKVVVGNIHVLFNPKRRDVKLGQVRLLLEKANSLSEKWGGIPVVLAGDFNSTPGSGIYEFISSAKLDVTLNEKKILCGLDDQTCYWDPTRFQECRWSDDELRNALGDSKSTIAEHPLKLQSAYASVKGNRRTRGPLGEPLATSFHLRFLGTVDYMWYSGLLCSKVVETFPLNILRKTGGLPTKESGSDHLPLLAQFLFPEPVALEGQDDLKQKDASSP